jgi:hypothetical protein
MHHGEVLNHARRLHQCGRGDYALGPHRLGSDWRVLTSLTLPLAQICGLSQLAQCGISPIGPAPSAACIQKGVGA